MENDFSRTYFARKGSLAFVQGAGPFPFLRSTGVIAFFKWGTVVLAGAAPIGFILGYAAAGWVGLGLAGLYAIVHWAMQRGRRKEERLAEGGMLLPAEFVSVKNYSDNDSGSSHSITFQFRDPAGQVIVSKSGLAGELKSPPPAGTPMLVLYGNDGSFVLL